MAERQSTDMNKACLYGEIHPQEAVFIHIPVANRLPVLSTGLWITPQHAMTQTDKMNGQAKKHLFNETGPHTGEDAGQAKVPVLSCTTAYRRLTGQDLLATPVEKWWKTVDNPLITLLITRQLSTPSRDMHPGCE